LHEGSIEGGRVTCPWHASMFNLADGSLVRGPATAPQPSYEVRVQDGKIEVRSRA
jgi:nitrite reductase/ring-hydroxylating ferredoxin subunit